MRFATIVALTASAAAVSAQKSINVIVGGNGTLTYSPASFTAAIGDTVTFEFQSKNHTVSQSLFASPCEQFVNTTIADPTQQQLTSGYRPVAANATSFPTWTIQITQSTPIWLFCAQTGHCSKGMVGAINAPTNGSNTFEAFTAKAMGATTGAGGNTTTGGGSPTNGTSGTPSGTASPSGSSTSTPNGALASMPPTILSGVVVSVIGMALGLML